MDNLNTYKITRISTAIVKARTDQEAIEFSKTNPEIFNLVL